jgi:hypothetical protein
VFQCADYTIDHQKDFLEAYRAIKDGGGPTYRPVLKGDYAENEWLSCKCIKNAIRQWQGKPLDVLNYIIRKELLEQAVGQLTKAMKRT